MSDILKICGSAMISLIVSTFIKEKSRQISMYLTEFTAITIIVTSVISLSPIISFLNRLLQNKHNSPSETKVIMIAVGISIICDTVCNICKEQGENTLSDSLEFAGNIQILLLSIPLINDMIGLIKEVIPI